MLKEWTKLEKTLLYGSCIIVLIVGIVFKSDILTTSCSIIDIIAMLLIAKGKNIGQLLGVLITVLYSIVSFKNRFYGEVIIYTFIVCPMYLIGIVSWIKHKNKETNSVEINKIYKREWFIVSIVSVIVLTGVYFLLKVFNTNELLVSTLSVLASLFGIYFQIRRSKYAFIFYVINDIIIAILWGIPVINGNYSLLPIFLNPVIIFSYDMYGFYNWTRLEKKQKEKC